MIQKLGGASGVWLGGKKEDDGSWFWLDGKTWQYQNWAISNPQYWANARGQCTTYSGGNWIDDDCDNYWPFICATNKQMMSGNHTFILEKASLVFPFFQFWWKPTPNNQSRQISGFQISWKIENGSLPDVKELVSRDLSGSVTTPGFGLIAPPEFYKERHEYTAVIELPYNITDVLGNGTFVVEVDITSPDQEVELLTTNLNYEFNHIEMNWTGAEAFCVSKGGHLASVSTPQDWQKLQEFYAQVLPEGRDYDDFLYLWLGGTDQYNEGEWEWTDHSKWSEEHWGPDEPISFDTDKDFLQLVASKSTGSEWIAWSEKNDTAESICQVPTKMKIQEDTQLLFTSKNISSLQFIWVAQDGSKNLKQVNDSIVGGFKLKWHIDGSKVLNLESSFKEDSIWEVKKGDQIPSVSSKTMRYVLNLIREAKKHMVSEKDLWNSVLKHRWNINILHRKNTCTVNLQQIVIKVAQDLNLTISFN